MNTTCPKCGLALPMPAGGGIPKACPRCLLGLAIDASTAAFSAEGFQPPTVEQLAAVFPQLEVQRLIGVGGMGAVYRARHRVLDRVVALKVLPPHLADRPDFAARFEREARALARLNHPNVVAIFDSGKAAGFYYLIMEYIDGVNLRQAIQSSAIQPHQTLTIVQQICDALQYAHDQGVVHRDIKPENILLDTQGRVRVADFGLARLLDLNQVSDTLTASRQVMGTPRYMAPEQLEGSHDVDHRADIYSLGVVFYELLTGELPLGRFPAPSQEHQVDRRLDNIVFRTLEKRPEARYQQASELRTDVDAISRSPASSRAAGYTRHNAMSQSLRFSEYRSRTQLFGLPFVHSVGGIDPRTGRPAHARGIIAIGPSATGVLAIGGKAVGVIALGGMAIGIFSLGGFSIGLLASIGGFAIGTGLAVGGAAVGMVAFGGASLGFAAMGGAAFGAYFAAPYFHTPPPPDFILAGFPLLVLLLFILTWPLLLFAFIMARVFTWANPPEARVLPPVVPTNQTAKPPRIEPVRRSGFALLASGALIGCLAIPVLGLLAFIVSMLFLVPYRMSSNPVVIRSHVEEVNRAYEAQMQAAHARERAQASVPGLTFDQVVVPQFQVGFCPNWLDVHYSPQGPVLSPRLVQSLQITDAKRQQLDAILQKHYQMATERDELRMEILGVATMPADWQTLLGARTPEPPRPASIPSGPMITGRSSPVSTDLIVRFRAAEEVNFDDAIESFWNEIDPLLDPEQQQKMRQAIHLLPPASTDIALRSRVGSSHWYMPVLPSLLGWDKSEAILTLRQQSENQLSWQISRQGLTVPEETQPLPPELRRYLPRLEQLLREQQQQANQLFRDQSQTATGGTPQPQGADESGSETETQSGTETRETETRDTEVRDTGAPQGPSPVVPPTAPANAPAPLEAPPAPIRD